MKRLIILSSIILFVVISGCGDQQLTIESVNDGIVIKEFSFDKSEAYSGDYVSLNLELQNIGEVEGTLRDISVFGGWLSSPISYTITEADLEPAYTSENVGGESRYYRERIRVDSLVSSDTDYRFGVRVKYDYQTEFIGTIRFVDPDYLDTLNKEQRDDLIVSNGIISSSVSNGPLDMNAMSGRSFIVVGSDPVYIKFNIKNVGSGYTYVLENDYSVSILSTTPVGLNCYNNEVDLSDIIRLSRGEKSTFICVFPVPTSFENYVDRSFKIVFDYSYYTDGLASITIKPSGLDITIPSSTSTPTTVAVEICDNGRDDDGDTRVDCRDPDCTGTPECACYDLGGSCILRVQCEAVPDFICNEQDFECDDPDCCCIEGEDWCEDGVDNDRDGLTDCYDPDCSVDLACNCEGMGGECWDSMLCTAVGEASSIGQYYCPESETCCVFTATSCVSEAGGSCIAPSDCIALSGNILGTLNCGTGETCCFVLNDCADDMGGDCMDRSLCLGLGRDCYYRDLDCFDCCCAP